MGPRAYVSLHVTFPPSDLSRSVSICRYVGPSKPLGSVHCKCCFVWGGICEAFGKIQEFVCEILLFLLRCNMLKDVEGANEWASCQRNC